MSKRKTYRFRNSKNHWAIGPHPTFWAGQRVARTSGTSGYQSLIEEFGVVMDLPERGSSTLNVMIIGGPNDGFEAEWSATECAPVRFISMENRRRLLAVAKGWSKTLDRMDRNGFMIEEKK